MNNKFLIGARKAGVILALALLGASAAWAAPNVVDVKLGDLSSPANVTLPGLVELKTWTNPEGTQSVIARIEYVQPAGTTTPASNEILHIVTTGGINVNITGTLTTGIRVRQISFEGVAGTNFNWDGATVTGQTSTDARAVANFLVATAGKINLLSGTIESSAKSLISGINNNANGHAVGRADDGGKTLVLRSHGDQAAIIGDTVFIPSPGLGSSYTIESDNVAIQGKVWVRIGTREDVSNGLITIRGWTTATGTSLNTGAAITVTDSAASSKIKIFGRGNRVTVSSKGKYVLEANKAEPGRGGNTGIDSAIYVKDATIEHLAATGIAGGVVFQGSTDPAQTNADIILEGVRVANGTSATTLLVGAIASTYGQVLISGGLYNPASGATGTAITTSDIVRIKSTQIRSGAATGNNPDYVVIGKSVWVEAGTGAGDTAIVSWQGTGKDVGAIKAKDSVYILANGTRRAEVRVVNGSGTAVYVYGNQSGRADTTVKVVGSSDGSAYIRSATGKALAVENDTGSYARVVLLNDAIIGRTGSPVTGKENLVDVKGAKVIVDGSSLTRSAIGVASAAVANVSPATVSNGVAIYAAGNNATTQKVRGSVLVKSGSIHGGTGAVAADTATIADHLTSYGFATKAVDIRSTSNVGHITFRASERVVINNRNAKIINTNGAWSNDNVFSAAVQSEQGGIYIFNVDTIRANTQATALLAKTSIKRTTNGQYDNEFRGDVYVYGGVIKSGTGPAIDATGRVYVHREDLTGNNIFVQTYNGIAFTPSNVEIKKTADLDNRSDVVISSASTNSAYSTISTKFANVYVGYAKVEATGTSGSASAIKDSDGTVTVEGTTDNNKTVVVSATGSAISVSKGDVIIRGGEIKSEGKAAVQSGQYVAAIYVVDGNVIAGEESGERSIITSDGAALAVFANGGGLDTVKIEPRAEITVKGINASYGGIKVLNGVNVTFTGALLNISTAASKAFAIEAATGDVIINSTAAYNARIISKDGNAITTVGGKIIVEDGTIVGDNGTLLWAKRGTGAGSASSRAGLIVVNYADSILNRFRVAIRAEDSLIVNGGFIATHTDTAIITGVIGNTAANSFAGTIVINNGLIWATGAYTKCSPVAVASKKVYMNGGAVWANTARESAEDAETYSDSKATGIVLRNAAGGAGELKITGGYVHGWGANIGIDNKDSNVVVDINSRRLGSQEPLYRVGGIQFVNTSKAPITTPGGVTVKAGTGGTAIQSLGSVRIEGLEAPSEESKDGDVGLQVYVYVGGGNGRDSRAILLPVKTGILRKDLYIFRSFVEAGSNGAVAIETDIRALATVDHSVVLVRDGSTAILAKGGVRVDGGYVEVLATENNTEGRAIVSNEIRIDGGKGEEADKSEVHSKGHAVLLQDAKEGAVVEITGIVHLSGTVGSNTTIGSSVLGDTAIVTMGSIDSRNLWLLSIYSDKTEQTEQGKTLTVPVGVTVSVADNGSRLETERSDTVKISGIVATVGKQAGAQFWNGGKVIVENGGNVKFNKADFNSFKNNDGLIVIKSGAKFDDSLLVHDTGALYAVKKYTYLKWADSLSSGARGPGQVVVPPLYATLYGDQSEYIDEEDTEDGKAYWSATSERTDSVYTAKLVKYPIDKRYKPYLQTEDKPAKGDFSVTGLDVIKTGSQGDGLYEVLFTEAGTFKRTATVTNEAGVGTKVYTHHITRVGLKQIKEWQAEGSGQNFFDGYLVNKDERVLEDDRDTVTVWDGDVNVKYTGSTAKLLDGIQGARFTTPNYEDIDNPARPIYFSGLGVHQFWYKGVEGTFYPLTSIVPTKVGTYEVWASFKQGLNFDEVPADENSIVYIGRVNVVAGDLTSIFGKKDNEYKIGIELEAKKAYSNVRIELPNLNKYSATYENKTDVQPTAGSTGSAALNGVARILTDSVLTFNIRNTSDYGQFIEFEAGIIPTSDPPNIEESGLFVLVRVDFVTADDMIEPTPNLTVNYRNEKITGLLADKAYTVNGAALTGVSEIDIDPEWIGTTVSFVALPTTQYKQASKPAEIVISARPDVSAELREVKADSASSATALDGRLDKTTAAMEYKLSAEGDSAWKPATEVVTRGLKAGTYEVRLAATKDAFASPSVTVVVYAKSGDKIAENDRVIPGKTGTTEAAVAPVAKVSAAFAAGPSPVSKNAGKIAFFSTKQVKGGTLYVFDANGNAVAKVNAKSAGKEIGSWNLKDKNGNAVAEGSYIVKGTLTAKDGTKQKVSSVFNVAK